MLGEDIISILKLSHGSYNSLVFLGFLVQATFGLRMRAARRRGNPKAGLVKFHRKFGPVLTVFGILGGLSGLVITYLDKGRILEYPFHLIGGMTVIVLIGSAFTASRAIKGKQEGPRKVHLTIGVLLLMAYLVQVMLGLSLFL